MSEKSINPPCNESILFRADHPEASSIDFNVKSLNGLVPVEDWRSSNLFTPDGRPGRIEGLLALIDDEAASVMGGCSVRVPYETISKLHPKIMEALGLPSKAPFRMCIRTQGNITQSEFRFTYQFAPGQGVPIRNFSISGPFIKADSKDYTLGDPFYSLVSRLDEFNSSALKSTDDKIEAWGKIREIISDEVDSDEYLNQFTVFSPDSFTLSATRDEGGEFSFDPVLLKTSSDDASIPSRALPPAYENAFIRNFNRRSDLKRTYPLGNGNYVVMPEDLTKALKVAKRCKLSDQETRKDFFRSPGKYIREAFNPEIGDDLVESLFKEAEGYAERVHDTGVWHPPVIPYIKSSPTPWLPPEEVGLRIGGKILPLKPAEVSELLEQVTNAIEIGLEVVQFCGVDIGVSSMVITALKVLAKVVADYEQAKPPSAESTAKTAEKNDEEKKRIALLIYRNLDDSEISARNRDIDVFFDKLEEWQKNNLNNRLLKHQVEGCEWLMNKLKEGSPGCLLADDMGLGKTIQTLVLLKFLRESMENGSIATRPILIVAPTGLLRNWEDEHYTHLRTPGLGRLLKAYGRDLVNLRIRTGKELEDGRPVLERNIINSHDWVLTTYETLRDYQHSFGMIHWGAVVFDEVQKIKNPKALATDAAKAMNTDFVIALTGTPVENSLADLWCILDRAHPGYLGSLKEFMGKYSSANEERLAELKVALTGNASGKTHPIMLRRLKTERLKGLPDIEHHELRVQMPESQAVEYSKAVQAAHSGKGEKGAMLKAIQKFRMVSLLPGDTSELSNDELLKSSARLSECFKILDRIQSSNEKALIFIEFREVQPILSGIIAERYSIRPPLIINGAVPGETRKDRVDKFQKGRGFDVMLLSPKAGGVGLTLTSANHVIHLSRWWNPAVEDQCTDRVYRIGQTKPVNVYYPLAIHPLYGESSFDVKLSELLAKKRQLSRSVLAPVAPTDKEIEALWREIVQVI